MQATVHTTQNNRRRKIAAIVAILLALAILLTGTFAWQSISQQAVNQAIVLPSRPGGRLHDDFEVMGENFGEREWSGVMRANKDIYVESFEPADDEFGGRQIFARIRLYEYMERGTGARLQPDDPEFESRLLSYTGPGGPTGEVEPLVPGTDRMDNTTWVPRIPEGSTWTPTGWTSPVAGATTPAEVSDLFRAYWTWGMGGQKWYMPTFNRDHYSLMSDTKGDAVDPQHDALVAAGEPANPTRTEAQGGAPGVAFPPEAGLHDFFDPANPAGVSAFSASGDPEWESPMKYWDFEAIPDPDHSITTYNRTHEPRETANAAILTMAEWMGLPAADQIGPFWVIDADGWAYWAQPIAANSATGLLMDYLELVEPPEYQVYYAIFANAQLATASGWMSEDDEEFGWFDPLARGPAPSAAATALMNTITGMGPGSGTTTEPPTVNGIAFADVGETVTVNGVEWRTLAVQGNNRLVITEEVQTPAIAFTGLTASHAAFWATNVGGATDLTTQVVQAQHMNADVITSPGTGWDGPGSVGSGLTAPGSAAGATAANSVFTLSVSEANTYFASDAARAAGASWWLRTPGLMAIDSLAATSVNATGVVAPSDVTGTNGFRPAMWVIQGTDAP